MKIFVNSLTSIRILATLILPIVWKFLPPIYLMVFVSLVLLTDFFDGLFARIFNVRTLFGSLLDMTADKVFGIVMILIVAIYFPIYYIIAILELLIALVNVSAALMGARTKSSFIGRVKMWVLGVSTVFGIIFIFHNDLLNIQYIKPILNFIINNEENLLLPSVFVTVGAEIMIVIDYAFKMFKELKNNKSKIKYVFKPVNEIIEALFDTEYYLANKNMPLSKHFLK